MGQLFLWSGLAGLLAGVAALLAVLLFGGLYVGHTTADRRAIELRQRAEAEAEAEAQRKRAPVTPATLSKDDLAFGEAQVREMVRDRPEMGKVQPSDPIWQYCVRAFAGEALGRRIYWDPVVPAPGNDTGFDFPLTGATPCIRFRRTSAFDPDYGTSQRWFWAAYCLEGLRGFDAIEALRAKGYHGDLNRDQWIRAYTRLTYEHLRRVNKIYWMYWRPTAKERRLHSVGGDTWATDLDSTYEVWFSRYAPYGWDGYTREYDASMARIHDLSLKVRKLRSAVRETEVGVASNSAAEGR